MTTEIHPVVAVLLIILLLYLMWKFGVPLLRKFLEGVTNTSPEDMTQKKARVVEFFALYDSGELTEDEMKKFAEEFSGFHADVFESLLAESKYKEFLGKVTKAVNSQVTSTMVTEIQSANYTVDYGLLHKITTEEIEKAMREFFSAKLA